MKAQLEYRLATPEDWLSIVKFVDSAHYFFAVEPSTLGGTWAIALDNGQIKACLWFFHSDGNAYIDYWVGGKITSITLLMFVRKVFEDNDIKYVRGSVHSKNESAARVVMQGFGASMGLDHNIFFKDMT